MVQHVDGGHLRIDAELLRQIAEDFAHLVLLLEHVDAVQINGSGIGILQRGDGAHQRALARAVRTEQAEHVIADGQREILERANAVRIGFGEIRNGQRHERTF